MRLGIFGGTFNPIHYGHLLLAEAAREQLRLDRVVFIPTSQPPHKSRHDLLSGAVRLRLVRLAIQGHPAFVASDLELRRGGVSYTVETLRQVRRRWPRARLFLLLGQDMLAVRWMGWEEITRSCTVVAAHRAGGRAPHQRALRHAKVRWMLMPQVDIASSEIRRRVRSGQSIRYLVPPAVERVIDHQRLFRRA